MRIQCVCGEEKHNKAVTVYAFLGHNDPFFAKGDTTRKSCCVLSVLFTPTDAANQSDPKNLNLIRDIYQTTQLKSSRGTFT